jgi:methylamine dehydrogenase accessory protein MauD
MIAALLLARFLLAAVFAVAGVAKLADRTGFRRTLADFGLPHFLTPLVAWLVPVAELACAAALLPVVSAWWGAVGVLTMLVLFCVGIGVSLARGKRPDCHCFGQLQSSPIGWKTLARNAVLAGIAGFVMWQITAHPEASAAEWLRALSGTETAMLALAVLAAMQFWMLFHLLRQNGRLLLRVEAIEQRVGISAEVAPPPPGLPVNSDAPGFRLTALDGATVTLDMLRGPGIPVLLVFSEPDCAACDKLLPELEEWQPEHAEHVSIAIISRGKPEANRAKMAAHQLQNVLLQKDREVAAAYEVTATPSAVLVRDGKIASPLAAGIDGIRGLVRQAILPAPVKKGDSVPSLRFPDLQGKSIDLAKLGGRRTLLLFWNPSCGFCQQMLADVKEWERTGGDEDADLVVVSAGSLTENREQGFRSTVLLDPGFAGLHVFNAAGTPSAVILDQAGRVASDVGVGADEVRALAEISGVLVSAGSSLRQT